MSASKLVAFALGLAALGAPGRLRAQPLPAAPPPAPSPSRANVYLSWVRLQGADSCPDVRQIADDVARRLGWNPFRETPTQFIEAQIKRDTSGDFAAGRAPGTWVAEIFLRDASGASRGNRVFTSVAPSCASLASVVALSIAIIIDPNVMLRRFSDDENWPGSPAAQPEDEARPAKAPPGARGSLALLGVGGLRMLPQFAPGFGLQGEVRLIPRLSLKVGGLVLPEVRTPPPDTTFAFGLTMGWLGGCFDALQFDAVVLGVCGAALVGILHPVVYSLEPFRPGERTFWGLSSGLRMAVRLSARVEVQFGGDGVFVLNRRQFTITVDQPASMEEVFTQPAAAALFWIGVGVRFR